MLALETVLVGLIVFLLVGYKLYSTGNEKLGILIRNITFITGLVYFLLVIIIGFGK